MQKEIKMPKNTLATTAYIAMIATFFIVAGQQLTQAKPFALMGFSFMDYYFDYSSSNSYSSEYNYYDNYYSSYSSSSSTQMSTTCEVPGWDVYCSDYYTGGMWCCPNDMACGVSFETCMANSSSSVGVGGPFYFSSDSSSSTSSESDAARRLREIRDIERREQMWDEIEDYFQQMQDMESLLQQIRDNQIMEDQLINEYLNGPGITDPTFGGMNILPR